jgi:aldose 1-epimerase
MSQFDSKYICLDNHRGLKGVFSTLGAGVKSLTLFDEPVILELKDEQTYLSSPQLFGKTVSRFIGRLPSEVEISGEKYLLKETSPGICLHGGLDDSMIYQNYEAEVVDNDQVSMVIFRGFSKDMECGFPGNLNVKASYILSKDLNILTIKYEAVSDKDTLISLSNHMYWNLSGSENVDDCTLKVNASRYGVFKKGTQLIESIAEVPLYFDFTSPSNLKVKLDSIERNVPEIGTLDHAFVFDHVNDLQPQVVLSDSNYQIECYTDFDAVNLYVDSTLSEVDFVNNSHLIHNRRRGIAIEPQQFVLDHFVLKANEVYSHFITYRLTKKD